MQYIYIKPSECVDIIAVHHEVFTAGALEERVLSGHQLGKPSDVRRILSTNEGSFVFIIAAVYQSQLYSIHVCLCVCV